MSAIKVGDLVVVAKPLPCCGGTKVVGRIFRVEEFVSEQTMCSNCGAYANAEVRTPWAPRGFKVGATQVSRLKRIPPLSELERDTEKLKETA